MCRRGEEGVEAGLEDEQGLTQIERVSEDIQSNADWFESQEEVLRERFQNRQSSS